MIKGEEWLKSSRRDVRDRAIAFSLLPAGAVLGAAGAGLSMADGHKPIYRQTRLGKNGQPFTLYKLRTMPEDTPPTVSWGPNDPRATPIARLLRLWFIDEVPQLYNILRGDLSIFGLRAVDQPTEDSMRGLLETPKYDRWQRAVSLAGAGCISSYTHDVRALDIPVEEKLTRRAELDITDVQNASPIYDLKLLLRTGPTLASALASPFRRNTVIPQEPEQEAV